MVGARDREDTQCWNGLHLRLDELIDQFLRLSQGIEEAINADECIKHVRALDTELSECFHAILKYETSFAQDRLKKQHFLLDQIVHSEDLSRRQELADFLKQQDLSSS